MTLEVLYFSVLRQVAECESEVLVDLPDSLDVRALIEILVDRHPALGEWRGRLLVAVDLKYAGLEDMLKEGQEIAIMPPTQGG